MKHDEDTTIPDGTWSVTKLTEYVRLMVRKTAVAAWLIGQALKVGRTKKKQEREYVNWLSEIGINRVTAWRYVQVAEHFALKELEKLSLKEVYERLEQIRHPKDESEDREEKPMPQVVPATQENDKGEDEDAEDDENGEADWSPSWAVHEPLECDELEERLDAFQKSLLDFITNKAVWEWWEDKAEVAKKLGKVKVLIDEAIGLLSERRQEAAA